MKQYYWEVLFGPDSNDPALVTGGWSDTEEEAKKRAQEQLDYLNDVTDKLLGDKATAGRYQVIFVEGKMVAADPTTSQAVYIHKGE